MTTPDPKALRALCDEANAALDGPEMVGGHKVELTRGIAMAFDFRAVPL